MVKSLAVSFVDGFICVLSVFGNNLDMNIPNGRLMFL